MANGVEQSLYGDDDDEIRQYTGLFRLFSGTLRRSCLRIADSSIVKSNHTMKVDRSTTAIQLSCLTNVFTDCTHHHQTLKEQNLRQNAQ